MMDRTTGVVWMDMGFAFLWFGGLSKPCHRINGNPQEAHHLPVTRWSTRPDLKWTGK
jgi:hypothetical protein